MKNQRFLLAFLLVLVLFVILFIKPTKIDHTKKRKKVESKKSEVFLVSDDWQEEPIWYTPSRFIKGKNIHIVALSHSDSVTVFVPYQKVTLKEYTKWIGRNKGNYEMKHMPQ